MHLSLRYVCLVPARCRQRTQHVARRPIGQGVLGALTCLGLPRALPLDVADVDASSAAIWSVTGWALCGFLIVLLGVAIYKLTQSHGKHADCLQQLDTHKLRIEASAIDHRRGENRFRTLIEATGSVVWATDAAGRVIEAQPSWERYTGSRWPKYQGESWLEAVHPEDRPRIQAEWRAALAARTICQVSGRLWHGPSNDYRHVTSRGLPLLEADGQLIGWICTVADADLATRAAERVRAAQIAAEVANRAKGEFLANVSHELRTPMHAIVGMTELALDEELSPLVRDYLETAKGSAEVLLKLVNEILDFSKLESGKFTLDTAPFRLPQLLDESIKAICLPAAEKGLELVCEVAPDVPDAVVGDSLRLRQILVNLLNNAVKFSSEGDVLLRAMVEHRDRHDVTLRFEVCDTGIGIPQADQDRIFDPFTQVDATTTRQHGGTGLGLAIATELVRLMGGRIGVHSTLGRGSTFYFTVTLPETPAVVGDGAHRARPLTQLAGLRVLIVDDNATNRRILENTLRHGHLNPVLATNGPACLAALRQAVAEENPFQVLIADALMPGMDGFTLVEQVKAEPQLVKAVIMMISSADRHTFRQRCDELGIDLYLEKPVSQAAMWEAIATATGGKRHESTTAPAASQAWGPTQSLRVLVAEDTLANQKIVKSILSKRGHAVEIARNGREVVEMIRHEPFDIILMDVQMPIMDGFQATSTIRSLEAHLGRRVPIIALTAHARQGDRERCLAAGMDDYLVKPVSAAVLVERVEHFRPASEATSQTLRGRTDQTISESRPAEPSEANPERRAAFDLEAALARLGNDRAFFANLVEFFVEDYPQLLGQIRSALQAQDAPAVAHAAHSLKGLVANFDAHPTVRVVSRMEKAGFDNDLTTVAVLMESLEHELVRLLNALLPYRGKLSASGGCGEPREG